MAEKDTMLSSANACAANVESAIRQAEAAQGRLRTAVMEVESNWEGDAATAMATALNAQIEELSTAITQLTYAASEMRSQASSIYNSWPEETTETADV